jgi:hypothetical protein
MIALPRLPEYLTLILDIPLCELEWRDISPLELAALKRLEERRAYRAAHGIVTTRDKKASQPKFTSRIVRSDGTPSIPAKATS